MGWFPLFWKWQFSIWFCLFTLITHNSSIHIRINSLNCVIVPKLNISTDINIIKPWVVAHRLSLRRGKLNKIDTFEEMNHQKDTWFKVTKTHSFSWKRSNMVWALGFRAIMKWQKFSFSAYIHFFIILWNVE